MKSYSLLIGSNNARGRFVRRDERLLQQITARHFPEGFTILAASGSWYDPEKKTFRHEEARQVLICTACSEKLAPWCLAIGRALQQTELILIEAGKARSFQIPGPVRRRKTTAV
jgi:hypothetical protein